MKHINQVVFVTLLIMSLIQVYHIKELYRRIKDHKETVCDEEHDIREELDCLEARITRLEMYL